MSEPEPLSKYTKEVINEAIANAHVALGGTSAVIMPLRALAELLAAEQFWREAVKRAAWANYANGGLLCNFCRTPQQELTRTFIHGADCPWVLAQE